MKFEFPRDIDKLMGGGHQIVERIQFNIFPVTFVSPHPRAKAGGSAESSVLL